MSSPGDRSDEYHDEIHSHQDQHEEYHEDIEEHHHDIDEHYEHMEEPYEDHEQDYHDENHPDQEDMSYETGETHEDYAEGYDATNEEYLEPQEDVPFEEDYSHVKAWGRALYNYEGETEEDLKFQVGDYVGVTVDHGDGWSRGQVDGVGHDGLFPTDYLDYVMEDSSTNEHEQDANYSGGVNRITQSMSFRRSRGTSRDGSPLVHRKSVAPPVDEPVVDEADEVDEVSQKRREQRKQLISEMKDIQKETDRQIVKKQDIKKNITKLTETKKELEKEISDLRSVHIDDVIMLRQTVQLLSVVDQFVNETKTLVFVQPELNKNVIQLAETVQKDSKARPALSVHAERIARSMANQQGNLTTITNLLENVCKLSVEELQPELYQLAESLVRVVKPQ